MQEDDELPRRPGFRRKAGSVDHGHEASPGRSCQVGAPSRALTVR
jgi:hypothetical protein